MESQVEYLPVELTFGEKLERHPHTRLMHACSDGVSGRLARTIPPHSFPGSNLNALSCSIAQHRPCWTSSRCRHRHHALQGTLENRV